MASDNHVKGLKTTAANFSKIDRAKLLRTSIGEESLERDLQPILAEYERKLEFAVRYAPDVHDQHVEHVRAHIQAAVDQLNAQAARATSDYINNKAALLSQLRTYLDTINLQWPPFVTAAIEKRGFLEDEGVKKEYEKTVSRMQEEAKTTLANIKKESDVAIEEARQLAKQIEERARRTATRISVEAAQVQFSDAQKQLRGFVLLWAALTIASLVAIGWMLHHFLNASLPDTWTWQIGYTTAIRLAALATLGSIAAFCMRLLKAQLHQYLLNMHRQRVTNSIAAFVESAVTPEQRDLILGHMVDSVVSFGNSGLLDAERSSDGHMPKVTVDNITRSFISPVKDPAAK